jgi:hypothetical protein
MRFIEFFTATIRNRNTRLAYGCCLTIYLAHGCANYLAQKAVIGPLIRLGRSPDLSRRFDDPLPIGSRGC